MRSLLLAGIGDPATWARCDRVPVRFVQATLQEWIDRHGGDEAGVRFDLSATLHRVPVDPYSPPGGRPAGRGGRGARSRPDRVLYIDVHARTAGVVVLGPTLDALAAVHPALARHFHDTFFGALRRWIHCYTWEEAEENVQCHKEQVDEMEWYLASLTQPGREDAPATAPTAGTPEQGGQSPEEDPVAQIIGEINDQQAIVDELSPEVPPFLRGGVGPDPSTVQRERLRLEPGLAAVLAAAEEMHRAAQAAYPDTLRGGLYEAQGGPLPGLLGVFQPQDAVEHSFEEEAQIWPQFEHEPSCRFELRADDPTSVADAFTRLGVMCRTLAAAAALMRRLPDNDAYTFDPG